MSKELPEGPFFDLIREWNAGVAELRAKVGDIPPGYMWVPAEVAELFRKEVNKQERRARRN